MARNKFILVSDDSDMIHSAENFCGSVGETLQVFSSSEWENVLENPELSSQLEMSLPGGGQKSWEKGAKILPFPGKSQSAKVVNQTSSKVFTINEIESEAIKRAIHEFGGNLTEAAKALGIGRATLYRKVKQYNIDPSRARKAKAA